MENQREKIAKRAMEIYLGGKGTLKEAYKQAKDEMLLGEIPKEIRDLFNLKRR